MMENNTEDIGTYKDVQNKLISDNQEFFILPNAKNLGLVDGLKAMENLSIIVNRAKKALENHFYIEFISLKIQYLEFLLRIYWVIKNPDNKVLDENSQIFFGTLIHNCETLKFEPALINKLSDFNSTRNKAIHKFMMGATNEDELKIVCEKYSKLGNEIYNYVVDECGQFIEDVAKLPEEIGTIIISRPKRI